MTRSSLLCGLLGLVSVGLIAASPLACSSGGVGDPCTPEDEYSPQFPGFQRTLENIESRSFQCETRICLVNHLQGRVSCPLGQAVPASCNNPQTKDGKNVITAGSCGTGVGCVESVPIAQDCTANEECPPPTNPVDGQEICDKQGKFCRCEGVASPLPDQYACDEVTHQFRAFVCHKENNCQNGDPEHKSDNCDANNNAKDCCVPGTDTPVVAEVSGQCEGSRSGENAVYCSCRCDVAPGQPKDPNFNFCTCPTGFGCSLIRPFEGLGQPELAGSYCVKTGTEFKSEPIAEGECQVIGHESSGVTKGKPPVGTCKEQVAAN
jgi:hypothetical protein